MPDFGFSQVELIGNLIDSAQSRPTKMGTVTGRDMTGSRCLVVFDGSSGVAQPVKCPESVVVDNGDRVGMVRYESDWIVTINYTLQTLCDALTKFTWGGAGTTTSTTFVDMPNSPTLSFTKRRDATLLRLYVSLSMFSAATTPSTFHIGMHLTSLDGVTSYDEDIIASTINTASVHAEWASWVTTAALPASTYTGTARWLRIAGGGTGALTVDSNDSITMHVIEVVS